MEVGDDWVDPCADILPEDPEDMTEELQEEHHLCMDDFFAANGEVVSRIQQEDVADMQGPECDIEADDFEDCMTEFAEFISTFKNLYKPSFSNHRCDLAK